MTETKKDRNSKVNNNKYKAESCDCACNTADDATDNSHVHEDISAPGLNVADLSTDSDMSTNPDNYNQTGDSEKIHYTGISSSDIGSEGDNRRASGKSYDRNKTRVMAVRALLVAVAMVLAWLEAQIPVFFAVPGMKLGLTNLVVLVALYRLGWKDALGINFIRIILAGLTFGNAFSMLYSAAGGLLSGAVMILLKKTGKFSVTTVSIAGGVMHNVGQIIVAIIVLETTSLAYYLIVLWASGITAGAVIGIISAMIIKRLPKNIGR